MVIERSFAYAAAPGIPRIVPDGWNTRKGAADKLGRAVSTIKNWEAKGWIEADGEMIVGKTGMRVHLFSDEYIEGTMRPMMTRLHPGRKSNGELQDQASAKSA